MFPSQIGLFTLTRGTLRWVSLNLRIHHIQSCAIEKLRVYIDTFDAERIDVNTLNLDFGVIPYTSYVCRGKLDYYFFFFFFRNVYSVGVQKCRVSLTDASSNIPTSNETGKINFRKLTISATGHHTPSKHSPGGFPYHASIRRNREYARAAESTVGSSAGKQSLCVFSSPKLVRKSPS